MDTLPAIIDPKEGVDIRISIPSIHILWLSKWLVYRSQIFPEYFTTRFLPLYGNYF